MLIWAEMGCDKRHDPRQTGLRLSTTKGAVFHETCGADPRVTHCVSPCPCHPDGSLRLLGADAWTAVTSPETLSGTASRVSMGQNAKHFTRYKTRRDLWVRAQNPGSEGWLRDGSKEHVANHLHVEVRTPSPEKPNDLVKITQTGLRTQTSGCQALPHGTPTGQGTLCHRQCCTEQAIPTHAVSVTWALQAVSYFLQSRPNSRARMTSTWEANREVRKSGCKTMLSTSRDGRLTRSHRGLGSQCPWQPARLPSSQPARRKAPPVASKHIMWSPAMFSPGTKVDADQADA